MLIGEISKKTGFSRDTIRYYEERGIITATKRRENNYKDYPDGIVGILQFVKRAKRLGMTLSEINDLARRMPDPSFSCNRFEKRMEKKLREIDKKILLLKDTKSRIVACIADCRRTRSGSWCAGRIKRWKAR